MGMWFVLFIISAKRIINVLLLAMSFWWPWIVDGCMSCFLFPEMEFQEYLHTPKAFLCVCLWLWLCCPAFLQTFSFFPSFSFRCRCLLKNRMRPSLCLPSPFSVSLPMLLAAFLYSLPFHLCSFSLFPQLLSISPLLLHLIALDWGDRASSMPRHSFCLSPMPCLHLFPLLLSHPLSPLLHHFTAFPLCCVVLFRLWLTSLPSLLFLPICHLPSLLSLHSFGFIIPVIQSHLFRWTFRFISV